MKTKRTHSMKHKIMAGMLVALSMLSVVQPALAREPICGIEPHKHTKSCYEQLVWTELACPLDESIPHEHSAACYIDEQILVCERTEEADAHEHSDECYAMELTQSEEPICGLEEHSHNMACFGMMRASSAYVYNLTWEHKVIGAENLKVTFQITVDDQTEKDDVFSIIGSGTASFPLTITSVGTHEIEILVSDDSDTDPNIMLDERILKITLNVTESSGNYSIEKTIDGFYLNGVKTGEQDAFVTKCKAPTVWSDETIAKANEIMADMSLEEKVGQMFLVHYPGDGSGSITQANAVIDEWHPGGFLCFAAMFNGATPTTVQNKTSAAQSYSKIPMLFTIDEEGGKVVRASQYTAFRSTKFQAPQEVAAGGIDAVQADAADKANFLLNLGFNVNHAPVADVSGSSGYIYARTYGGNGLYNSQFVAAAVEGHETAGVATTMKHFPGYGGTGSNTHNGFAVNDLSLGEFEYNDLLPFYAGMHAGGKAVMVTHNIINAIDSDAPASLSKPVIDYLRNKMGFDGLVMTDDLNMAAVTQYCGGDASKSALYAIKAGVDMPMTPIPEQTIPVVLSAVNSGEIPVSQIEDSCRRVLCWKIETGIINEDIGGDDPVPPPPVEEVEAVWTKSGEESKSGSFESMWAYATTNGGTITLMVDVDTTGDKAISTENVTLNLNGHKLHFTSGTNGFIINNNKKLTINDTVNGEPNAPIIDETVSPSMKENAAYNAVRNELVYHTYQDDGKTLVRHDVNFDSCGQITGANTGIMIEVSKGTFTMNGGVLSHKVRAVETITNASNVININGGAIVNCGTAQGGTTVNGSGIGVYGGGTVNINGGYIAGCSATTRGAAIYVDTGKGKVNMNGGVIAANSIGTNGGAIYLNTAGVFTMTGGTLASNQSGSNGGAVYGINAAVHISGGLISDNQSGNGGGIFQYGESSIIEVTGGKFTGNRATSEGGAIGHGAGATNGKSLSVSNALFAGNTAAKNGGAILAGNVTTVSISDSEFHINSAALGGAVNLSGVTTATLKTVNITNNTATSAGAGVYYDGTTLNLQDKIVIRNNMVNNAANNLYLPDGKSVVLTGLISAGSDVGVYSASTPTTTNSVTIATASNMNWAQNAAGLFRSDREEYHFEASDNNVVLKIGAENNQDEIQYDSVLFQYYASIPRFSETGAASRRLEVIDTTGGVMPTNGVYPQVRYLYLNEDGSVKMEPELIPVYSSKDVTDTDFYDISALNKFMNMEGYYQVDEIWVATSGKKAASLERTDWTVYDFNERVTFTTGAENEDSQQIHIEPGYTVRFVASAQSGESDAAAVFYDYDISDGLIYASNADAVGQQNGVPVTEQPAWDSQKKTQYMSTYHQGINSDENYDDLSKAKLGFGNANMGTGRDTEKIDNVTFNTANRNTNNFNLCSFGIVTGLDENGHLIYNTKISAPNLFNEGDAVGKTTILDKKLGFIRQGEVYTFNSISGTSLDNLAVFGHPGSYTNIWTNNFWPLDEMGTFGAEGHDIKFGGSTLANYRKYATYDTNNAIKDGNAAAADAGVDHNGYFGMQFAMEFELEEDYIGPMEYVFFGDDDMWVFLDGKLICDVGGVHKSAGSYTNLWDYIEHGTTGQHELQFFFTERGASGSTCWMQFSIPHMNPVTEDVVTFPGSLRIEKTVEGIETSQEFEFDLEFNFTDVADVLVPDEFKYTGSKMGTLKSGDTIKLADGEYILIQGLPEGTQYTVTEHNSMHFVMTSTDTTGVIGRNQSTASFVNKYQGLGTLHISKTVNWLRQSGDALFAFKIQLYDAKGTESSAEFSYTGSKSGTLSSGDVIYLTDGAYIDIFDIPDTISYRITELATEGFVAEQKVFEGMIANGQVSEATFVNNQVLLHQLPLSGGNGANIYWMLGGCTTVFAPFMIILFMKLKRIRH